MAMRILFVIGVKPVRCTDGYLSVSLSAALLCPGDCGASEWRLMYRGIRNRREAVMSQATIAPPDI